MSGAKAVREDRLWQRHADMARLGGTPKGGVNRQALSAEDAAARNLLGMEADGVIRTIFMGGDRSAQPKVPNGYPILIVRP